MKTCSRCTINKNGIDFRKNSKSKDGLDSWCKQCRQEYGLLPEIVRKRNICHKKWYAENGKKYSREYRRREDVKIKHWEYRHTAHAIEIRRKRDAINRMNRTNKFRARDAVKYAVMSGKIPAASSVMCRLCGKQANEYDHYLGYARQHYLNVQALCWHCHRHVDSVRKTSGDPTIFGSPLD